MNHRHTARTHFHVTLALFLLTVLAGAVCHGAPLPPVTITRVLVSAHSVKLQYAPVAGAADYRAFAQGRPLHVKYAGIRHVFDNTGTIYLRDEPQTEIEFNGLPKNVPVTLVVEAVNAVGPAPPSMLYDGNNQPLAPPTMSPTGMDGIGSNMGMLGSIEAVNGQGPPTSVPAAIARGTVTVTASGGEPVPSGLPGATQCVMASWTAAKVGPLVVADAALGNGTQAIRTNGAAWSLGWHQSDLTASSFFIDHLHAMLVLFDAASHASGLPMHIAHGAVSLTPAQSFTGPMIHAVCTVDAHFTGRRWVTPLTLAPANDPVTNFDAATGPVNKPNTALFFQVQGNTYFLDEYTGINADGSIKDVPVVGGLGQAPTWGSRPVNGRGLDDRSRFDEFVTATHFQAYEDGVQVVDCDLPVPLPWIATGSSVSWAGYLYHSSLARDEMRQYNPYETYWIDYVPYSQEFHLADQGVESLPSTTTWDAVKSCMGMVAPGWARVGQ